MRKNTLFAVLLGSALLAQITPAFAASPKDMPQNNKSITARKQELEIAKRKKVEKTNIDVPTKQGNVKEKGKAFGG